MPNPQFLDARGEVASSLLSDEFSQWIVSKDRVEVRAEKAMVFASHFNIGFITFEKERIPECLNRMDEGLKLLGDLPPARWGVRIFSLIPSKKAFSTLLSSYKSKLLKFSPKDFSKIDGALVDVGISYVFKSERDKYHLTSGPMERKQAKMYFPEDDLPKNGIFIDLDVFREKDDFYRDDFRRLRITSFVSSAFAKGEEVISQFCGLLNDK